MKFSITLPKLTLLVTPLLVSQAFAAAEFSPVDQPLGYIGPIELSNTDLEGGGVKGYRGWFENGAWQGDVIEYDVSTTGDLSTSIDLTGVTPVQTTGGTNWSALLQFDIADDTAAYWDTGRKIITHNGSSQVAFRWANLSDAQKAVLDSVAFANGDASSGILDFVRGNRVQEYPAGIYRSRFSLMGDVIHTKPEYVQTPDAEIPDSSYITFINDNLSRAARVYAGANDGMLHVFNAASGDEVWAYIPSMVIDNLSKLAGRPFSHTYFIDGEITISDAFFGSDWHSVLVGSLGAGGKGLYGLDITSPDLTAETAATGDDKKFLWEIDDSEADMGYVFGPATIAKLNDGVWYAIAGNGVSSTSGIAKLFIINIETGVVKELSTGSGSAGSPNGLAAPALVDTDNDGKADLAYAGDIDGDLWKFDLTDATAANWNTAYKLFDGPATQPITTAPDVTTHPVSGLLVMYGTGRLYTADDITNTDTQALYGIWDKGTTPASSNKLAQVFSADQDYISGSIGETVRTITSTTAVDWSTHTGWKIEFAAGERVLTPPQLRSGRLKATVTNPDGFTNWLVEVSFDDGGYTDDTIFDLDQNLVLDTLDRVDYNLDSDLDDLVDIPMAWQRRDGNMSQVTIARIGQGQDTLFFNYLNPAIVPPSCTGDCEGGIGGGHMDVDTDANVIHQGAPISDDDAGLGDKTMGHQHEYDDKVERTYVDYFDIDPLRVDNKVKLYNVDEVVSNSTNFIILVANADLSPGADLTIGTQTISVVEYQRMIHKALAAWDGVPANLTDADFGNLVYKLPKLTANNGTLRNTFDSLAIINGGLHPTLTGCVNKDASVTNGRWRNGALIIHLIDVDHFAPPYAAGEQPLDRITVQNPTDMYKSVVLASGTEVLLAEDLNKDGDTDDATSPEYEVYGGLTATGQAEFLYESTLFWHYKKNDISSIVGTGNACYGEPEWEADVAIIRNGLPQEFFDDLLIAAGFTDAEGYADLEALMTAFDALEALGCKDIDEKKDGCKKEYKALLQLVELSYRIDDGDPTNNSNPPSTGLQSAGTTPVVIEGAVTTGGVTSGPNFSTGRRTWIDIMPLGNF